MPDDRNLRDSEFSLRPRPAAPAAKRTDVKQGQLQAEQSHSRPVAWTAAPINTGQSTANGAYGCSTLETCHSTLGGISPILKAGLI